MTNTYVEILVLIVLVLINGFFSMAEIAIVSARKVRLEQRADEGDTRARTALELVNSTSNFLSSVQIGITLVSLLLGAFGGVTLAAKLSVLLAKVPWLASAASTLSIIIVVLLTTYFSLVIGELIPKKIALNNPESIASSVAGVMKFISKVTSPIIHLLSASTDLGVRLLGIKPSAEPPITEAEIKVLMDQGTQVGVFAETEQDMVEGVFRLNERSINAIMTPRTEIVWLDVDDPIDDLMKIILQSPYSRFPVARGSLDNILGILTSKSLLEKVFMQQPFNILDLLEKPLFVPENSPAIQVLDLEKEQGMHEALVIDEYGGVVGFVTLFDVLESIIGQLPNQGEKVEPEILQRDDGSFLLDGLLPIDEFKELFDLGVLPEEEKVGFQTVGGFVMNQIGSIPSSGQSFDVEDVHIEVVDMDGNRVDKVLASRLPERNQTAAEVKPE